MLIDLWWRQHFITCLWLIAARERKRTPAQVNVWFNDEDVKMKFQKLKYFFNNSAHNISISVSHCWVWYELPCGIIISLKNPSWTIKGINLFLTGLQRPDVHLCSFLSFPFLERAFREIPGSYTAHTLTHKRKSSWLNHDVCICIKYFNLSLFCPSSVLSGHPSLPPPPSPHSVVSGLRRHISQQF